MYGMPISQKKPQDGVLNVSIEPDANFNLQWRARFNQFRSFAITVENLDTKNLSSAVPVTVAEF
jgi:hypothetical protein